jgi:hypothetical protein
MNDSPTIDELLDRISGLKVELKKAHEENARLRNELEQSLKVGKRLVELKRNQNPDSFP